MKKILILLIIFNVQGSMVNLAWADGEQRNHEPGTKWVDPVEFFELQDINRTDFQRDYDQGDIDFNKVVREKGVKVYGLRLKPIAGAMRVRKFMNIGYDEDFVSATLSYQDLYGIEGVPLHEASFCVYFDETVSRTYSFDYTYSVKANIDGERYTDHGSSTSSISISGIRLVANGDGVAFSYALTCKGKEREHTSGSESMQGSLTASDVLTKPNCVDERLGHFIYFSGGRYLLAMLAATAKATADKAKEMDLIPSERELMSNHPWPRVYFIVEEILVDAGAAAAEEAAITGKDPEDVEGSEGLTNEDKTELMEYMEDLVAWLGGEGDPFGFGERTDENTAAVINTIATVSSILLGTGLAGVFGGTGASIAGGMTEAILSGAGGGVPPTMPEPPQIDGLEPKRPEEEEEKEDNTPPPPEKKPDFFGKYTRTDADGDIYVKDPVTGKETLYINNGDGTYRNFNTDQNWSPDEINENLRYRDENLGLLKQDADQAARNAAEQHEQWVNHDSKELSQEGKDYLDWKHKQEAAERKQEKIEELAKKYGVPPTEESIKRAIRLEQSIESAFADENRKLGDAFEKWENSMKVVDKTCEIGVNVMATCVPGGEAVKDAYTFAKATLVAASEAVAEGKSLGEGLAHVAVGVGNGVLGVVQNQAGNLTEGKSYALLKEYGITVGTEGLKDGITAYCKRDGDFSKAYSATLNAIGKKSAEFGISKGIGAVFGFVKDSAKQTLNPGSATIDTDTGFRFSNPNTAKTIDKWLNKTHSTYAGHRADVFKVKVSDAGKVSWGGKGQGFSIFYSGKIDTGKLAEGVVNETLVQTGAYDPAGELASGLGNDVVNFAQDVANFSNMAADFRKK